MEENQWISLENLYSISQQEGPEKGVIVDVRSSEEYNQGHIKGAINRPLPELEHCVEEMRQFPRVYIHCNMGGRAQKAFQFLADKGLTNVYCLKDGGFKAWAQQGHPVETTPPRA